MKLTQQSFELADGVLVEMSLDDSGAPSTVTVTGGSRDGVPINDLPAELIERVAVVIEARRNAARGHIDYVRVCADHGYYVGNYECHKCKPPKPVAAPAPAPAPANDATGTDDASEVF